MEYRKAITERTANLISEISIMKLPEVAYLVELGINHEQQHQELLITDVKHIFANDPSRPIYKERSYQPVTADTTNLVFHAISGGMYEIGASDPPFAYDNEFPRHRVFLDDFRIANRTVTCGEYLEFMEDNGYGDHRLWLSDGWNAVNERGWKAPMYWEKQGDDWMVMTLSGFRLIDPNEPVCHVSYYEAAAFARWADKRLPTEAEWEVAAEAKISSDTPGGFLDDQFFHPVSCRCSTKDERTQFHALLGNVWEWTGSAYLSYPGYRQSRDALGEYNGKFMSDQMVLRGGSCATPQNHIRTTYRNFFQCDKRWQFTGIRLAE
jgi:ergothioneine biosynthesis protein EgtB